MFKMHEHLLEVMFAIEESYRQYLIDKVRDDQKAFEIWKLFKRNLRLKNVRDCRKEKLTRRIPTIGYPFTVVCVCGFCLEFLSFLVFFFFFNPCFRFPFVSDEPTYML